jgi:thioredoxin 2
MTAKAHQRIREIANTASFSEAINQPACPALVLFDAVWCSPARRIENTLLRFARGGLRTANFDLVRVDVDRLPEIARRFAIHAVPALALFRFGQVAAMRLGEIGDHDLRQWLDNAGLNGPGVEVASPARPLTAAQQPTIDPRA